jgi:drug/metabolite transporter (DMT)-like permease
MVNPLTICVNKITQISVLCSMDNIKKAYLELHVAVFLFGITAILGDLIQLSALLIVWWRVLITSISLVFMIRVVHLFKTLPVKAILQFMGIGILVAIHWLAFYGAIKLSNASITLVCMATTSFFTAFLEPLIMRHRVRWYEIALGLLIIPGMALIVDSTDSSMNLGIVVGLIAAFMAALFATFNKRLIGQSDELSITFLELGSACLFLTLVLPFYILQSEEPVQVLPSKMDWVYLMILALLCTTLAYVLALRALRYISAFAANLTVNLEPVYGIILAWILLNENEELSPRFYWGVVIILLAVFSYPLIRKIWGKNEVV